MEMQSKMELALLQLELECKELRAERVRFQQLSDKAEEQEAHRQQDQVTHEARHSSEKIDSHMVGTPSQYYAVAVGREPGVYASWGERPRSKLMDFRAIAMPLSPPWRRPLNTSVYTTQSRPSNWRPMVPYGSQKGTTPHDVPQPMFQMRWEGTSAETA